MDNLKLLASMKNQFEEMLKIAAELSNDIDMRFGLDKCCITNKVTGQIHPSGFHMENDQNSYYALIFS